MKEKEKMDMKDVNKMADAIIKCFNLDNPVDFIAAQRLAQLTKNMQECDRIVKKYGLIFEIPTDKGTIIKVNEVAYLAKQYEGEFRNYLRMFKQRYYNQKKGVGEDSEEIKKIMFGEQEEEK